MKEDIRRTVILVRRGKRMSQDNRREVILARKGKKDEGGYLM